MKDGVFESPERVPVMFRPLLVNGILGVRDGRPIILVDTDQPESEQLVTVWHEALHLLGLTNEAQVEALAQRLAAACPEILPTLKAINV